MCFAVPESALQLYLKYSSPRGLLQAELNKNTVNGAAPVCFEGSFAGTVNRDGFLYNMYKPGCNKCNTITKMIPKWKFTLTKTFFSDMLILA